MPPTGSPWLATESPGSSSNTCPDFGFSIYMTKRSIPQQTASKVQRQSRNRTPKAESQTPNAKPRTPNAMRLIVVSILGVLLLGAAIALRMRAGDRAAELRSLKTDELAALA